MPGARVVDPGHTSRDGYDMVVESFGPGAAGPAFVTVDAADAQQVIDVAMATDNVVDARVVAPPAATGRVVVRVMPGTPSTTPPPPTSSTASASQLDTAVPNAEVGGPAAQNHDLTAVLIDRAPLRDRDHPGRRVRAAARRVPQPRHRARSRSC